VCPASTVHRPGPWRWQQGAGRDFLAPGRRGRAAAAVHYQNSTATITGSYKEAAVRSRGKRAADGSQWQGPGTWPLAPGPGALPPGSGAQADRQIHPGPCRRQQRTGALTVPAWGLHGRNHAATHHHATQAQASRQPERDREKVERCIPATSPRLCQKVVIAVSRGARGALAWRPSRPFSSFPGRSRSSAWGPGLALRRAGPRAYQRSHTPGPPGLSSEGGKDDILLLCILLGDQESRTTPRKSAVHLSEKGRYTACLFGGGLS